MKNFYRKNFHVANMLINCMKAFSILALLFLFSTSNLSAQITADGFQQMLGRGLATGWFKTSSTPYDLQVVKDIKARGFDHVRVRVDAGIHNSNAALNSVADVTNTCVSEGLMVVISWVNHTAEDNASASDKADFLAFWSSLAEKLQNQEMVAYNIFTELGNQSPIRNDISIYEDWVNDAKAAIRSYNSQAIIIANAPGKTQKTLKDIPLSVYENDEYLLVEWHLYASGPNNKGGQKNWEGCGSASDKDNVTSMFATAMDWSNSTGVPTYYGAWMPWENNSDSGTGSLDQSEVECFAKFFLDEIEKTGIPSTLNAIQHVYDSENHVWYTNRTIENVNLNMEIITEIVVNYGRTVLNPPAAPSNAAVSSTSCNSVSLTWDDNSDNETGFEITQSENGGSYTVIANVGANATSHAITGLSENTDYTFGVKAVNNDGQSGTAISNAITTGTCQAINYTLTVNIVGNGSVTPNGGTYNEGEVVTLTATPAEGSEFSAWSGDATGSNATINITMDADKNVTATFSEIPSSGETITLQPTDDAFVNLNNKRTNYGTRDDITLKSGVKEGFIKFDLSSVASINTAEIQLTTRSAGNIEIYAVSDDNWNEDRITWKKKVAYTTLVASHSFSAATTETIDVTAYISDEFSTDQVVSIAIIETDGNTLIVDSKESANSPQLIIQGATLKSATINDKSSEDLIFNVYPNPSNGIVTVQLENNSLSNTEINITTLSGKVIESHQTIDSSFELNLSHLPNGIYFLVIRQDTRNELQKLIINK
jgi:hypothetical protein